MVCLKLKTIEHEVRSTGPNLLPLLATRCLYQGVPNLVPLFATRCLYHGVHLKTQDGLLQTENILLKTKDNRKMSSGQSDPTSYHSWPLDWEGVCLTKGHSTTLGPLDVSTGGYI